MGKTRLCGEREGGNVRNGGGRVERTRLCSEREGGNVWNGGAAWKGRGCVRKGRGKVLE